MGLYQRNDACLTRRGRNVYLTNVMIDDDVGETDDIEDYVEGDGNYRYVCKEKRKGGPKS